MPTIKFCGRAPQTLQAKTLVGTPRHRAEAPRAPRALPLVVPVRQTRKGADRHTSASSGGPASYRNAGTTTGSHCHWYGTRAADKAGHWRAHIGIN